MSAETASSALTSRRAGQQAAELLLDRGIAARVDIHDTFDSEYATALVQSLAAGIEERIRGFVEDIVEGAGLTARNLNVEPEHGLLEILQNADDLGAGRVRFQFVQDSARGKLLRVAHDGARVEAPHVLAMTLAFISTKRDNAAAIGKFGVGLKTLSRLCEAFQVHSWPYAFRVANQRLMLAEPRSTESVMRW